VSTPGTYRLAAMGDVMMARDVGQHFASAPGDFAMADIRRLLSGFDMVLLNLENPVAIGGRPDPVQDPHVTFRAHPATLRVVKDLGVRVVALGNNHMLDYGEQALAETIEHLNAVGIGHVGAGRNYDEANRPLLVECNGRQLAFLSYAFIYSANTRMATRTRGGVSDHRLHRIVPRIKELAKAGRDVIVLCHWGYEYSLYPLPYQMRIARRMIDAGATLVLGHGPHYPQGIEDYQGGKIVYSTGNFIFDEPHKYANRSFVYGVDIDSEGRPTNQEIHPIHLDRHVPRLVNGAERRRLEQLIEGLSARYKTKDEHFWRSQSIKYFTDICARSARTRNIKYLLVPTPSFYRDVGPAALLRKFRPSGVMNLSRAFGYR
jgi:poly-gamma-glutamate capsule biosynthesis protein CapA/YwtB (metallophosphatase superfamily)